MIKKVREFDSALTLSINKPQCGFEPLEITNSKLKLDLKSSKSEKLLNLVLHTIYLYMLKHTQILKADKKALHLKDNLIKTEENNYNFPKLCSSKH